MRGIKIRSNNRVLMLLFSFLSMKNKILSKKYLCWGVDVTLNKYCSQFKLLNKCSFFSEKLKEMVI